MLPGSIDLRRPDKQQRYKPPPASNNAAPGEDLTPDYMNILDSQRKSMQTPRSDRFKVVKIESTEPFKRGRWKCMDFLDQSYAKVFQQNYNNRPTETRPPSPKNHIDPNKTNSSGSWGSTASYVDLQSSMLQIFYRQNSIENHNACSCDQNSEIICCDAKRKYQNHVLMPGMVSSSLVGIDFPIELNFVPDNAGQLPPVFKDNNTHSFSNNNQSSLAHNNLSCCCKSQTSSIDIQKFHQNMSSDHLTIPASQIANYAQLKQDLIQKNLNVSPQELINQNSGITQYMHNLINNDPNSTLNFSNNQQTLIKEEQIIDNQNGTNIGQMITQNLLPANQSNGSELKSTPFNNNNPIYVNIQNLTCPQQTVNIPESNKNIISDQQITSTSNDSSTPMHLSPLRISESQIKNAIENVCDSTTQAENMAQNNTVINGNYVPNNFVQNSIPNNTDSVQTEYYQNLVQNLDPNNPNMVQKYVVQNIIPNNNIVQNPVSNNTIVPNSVPNNMVQNSAPNNNIVQNTVTNTSMLSNSVSNNNKVQNSVPNNLVQNSVPTNNIVQTTVQNNSMVQNSVPNNNIIQNTATNNNMQNCSPTPTNNVHYIVYSNNNSVANNGNCMQSYDMNNTNNTLQNYVPNNGNYVQNVVQNTTNTTQNLVAANDNSNMMQNNPNSNQNLSPNNGNSNQNLVQSADKIQQSMNMYQGQISLIEGTSCNYKQDITPIFQSSQNSIQSTLQSNTCIHAFLNEERALVQNTNSNEGKNVTNLPVDTKIEALMDLVKKHLKCTVMEDVNVLKHKILELKERIAQLEYENELLKNQYKRNNMQ